MSMRALVEGPPVEMSIDVAKHAAFTIVCAVPTVGVLVMAARGVVKHRNFMWPLFIVGGTLAMFVEPLIDSLGGVWWPTHGDWEAFTVVGIHLPWFVPIVFPWLLGGQAYLAYRAFERGCNRRTLWSLVGLFALTDFLLENVGLQLGAFTYYGSQPLVMFDLPLWFVPCNALGPVLAGALMHVLVRTKALPGARILLAAGVFPMSFLGVYAMCAFPMWISLNSGWGTGAATLCAFATFTLAYLLVQIVAALVVPSAETASGEAASGESEPLDRMSTTCSGTPRLERI